jgi:hypothetical protein
MEVLGIVWFLMVVIPFTIVGFTILVVFRLVWSGANRLLDNSRNRTQQFERIAPTYEMQPLYPNDGYWIWVPGNLPLGHYTNQLYYESTSLRHGLWAWVPKHQPGFLAPTEWGVPVASPHTISPQVPIAGAYSAGPIYGN